MKGQEEVIKSYEDEFLIGDDSYYVHYEIEWNCYMDGIGSYEYWGSNCHDEGSFCADLIGVEITEVYDFDGNKIEVSDELRKELEDQIVKFAEFAEL